MPKGKAKPKTPVVTKFKVGDKARGKHGIRDTDYPDMPLGGWAGTISEIHDHGMYTVRWSRETLAAIDPVFKKLGLTSNDPLPEVNGKTLETYHKYRNR